MFKAALPLAALLAFGACTLPPPETANLPPDAVVGAGDPLRSAVANTSVAFSSPALLAGRPVQAAQAVAQMEWLAVEMPTNPRLTFVSPTIISQMVAARAEWRAALGIPPGAEAQPVINSLYAAARALSSGQPGAAEAALPSTLFAQGGQATLMRLAAMPVLPLTNVAAVGATDAIRQRDPASGRRL
ncbi:hypothetical protein JMJ55_16220 [Belnapia sp. T6]|uniref:Uncharacterized protein n=1 Tax=Belnapia mucosa TaxID=2804532 RepID=A0ABS1V5B9_9PROT|nr:hypothetical protein [Belnapia mucosa]MBL6456884.1 hypothetical protein [Belnapia mucosa]